MVGCRYIDSVKKVHYGAKYFFLGCCLPCTASTDSLQFCLSWADIGRHWNCEPTTEYTEHNIEKMDVEAASIEANVESTLRTMDIG